MKLSLSIEIGEEYFKIAVGKMHGVQGKMHESIIVPVQGKDDAEIGSLIAAELKKRKYKSRSISVSLPRNFVTVRNLHLPSSDEEEIKKMITFHITRIVPHKIEDVVFSYCLSGTDAMGYKRVTLAIAHNDIIKRQVKILDKAGFLVDRIMLSSYCVWQEAMKEHYPQVHSRELYIVLDVDTVFTDFIIFEKDNILYSRSISVKAKEIENEMGLKKLLGEARQSLLIFQNEEVNKKPKRLFLRGAAKETVAAVIETELELPVTFAPPPAPLRDKAKPAPPEEEKARQEVSLSAVSHLALLPEKERKLSFVLPEIEIRKSLKEKITGLLVLGSLTIYALGVICSIFLSKIYNQELYLGKLQNQYLRIEKNIGGLAQQSEKIEFAKEYLNARRAYLYAFYELQQRMPANMALNNVRINEDARITVRGQVFQLSDVFNFVSTLEQVEYFKDVQTKYTRKGKWQNQEVTDFELTFQMVTE